MNLSDMLFISSTLLMWYLTHYIYTLRSDEFNIEKIVHEFTLAQSIIISSVLTGISVNIMIRDKEEI